MALKLGRFEVYEVKDGSIALDGGGMFGVVPRPLWEKQYVPDDRNRVSFALRCLLLRDGERTILVDAGAGTRWDGKHREMYGLLATGGVEAALAAAGVTRADVTDVILTHLHFDHAGGSTRQGTGGLELSFPNATYHLQRRHWRWAHHPSEKDQGSFRKEDFLPLERSGRLHLLEGNTELYPGVHLVVSEGHTVGLQLVRLESDDKTLFFCSDLVPTTAHLRPAWLAAYDLYPLTAIEEKKQLLAQALEEEWILFFEHDPHVAACTVKDDGSGHLVVNQVIPLS